MKVPLACLQKNAETVGSFESFILIAIAALTFDGAIRPLRLAALA